MGFMVSDNSSRVYRKKPWVISVYALCLWAILFVQNIPAEESQRPTMYVKGSRLFDPCGDTLVLNCSKSRHSSSLRSDSPQMNRIRFFPAFALSGTPAPPSERDRTLSLLLNKAVQ